MAPHRLYPPPLTCCPYEGARQWKETRRRKRGKPLSQGNAAGRHGKPARSRLFFAAVKTV
ncbi:hypothetical protein VE23_14275 [Paenibacillus sp. D9]|nr:hypothetical protein VE23_14275 [Paenibacillus sp. D9]CDN43455.1 hypothetical protein BN871_CZ_00260 [Paenibacillus sp. P22]